MSDAAILRLEGTTFSYGTDLSPAIRDFSLAVEEGQSVALLGANGSGKSTLIKILAGLLFPQSGWYSALGRAITPEFLRSDDFGMYFRKEVGIVFQNPDAQLFNPTVEEEIAFGPLQLDEPADEVAARVNELLELFGIGSLAARPPYALSGGEKKKVAVASVLATDPRILLLDEPTASLDPRSSHDLVGHLIRLRNQGRTLVTATHDLHLVPELATRVIVLGEDKTILADDSPQKILGNPELLHEANLLHLHQHFHDGVPHTHEHGH